MRTVAIVVAVLWRLAAACRAGRADVAAQHRRASGMITNLEFTPDGKFIVSAGEDKVIRVWDWRAGKTVRTMRGHSRAGAGRQNLCHGAVARWALAGGGGMVL